MKYRVDIQLITCVDLEAENEDQAYELAKNVPLLNLEFARGIRVREATQSDKNQYFRKESVNLL